MVAQVIGAAITAGACRVLLPRGLVVWEWYAPRRLLSLLMDVACILIVKSARTFEPLLLPRRCMIRVRDHLMWKGCDPCHDFRV